jgi:protein arginine kinase
MLHLPGLKISGNLEKFFNAARAMNLAVRGLFGEGTEAVGDCFQLSNQQTLGVTEEEIVNNFTNQIVPKIVDYEKTARSELLDKKGKMLEDKVFRALGILRHAQMISSQEALYLLSNLRLGVNIGKIKCVDMSKINDLFMRIQPGHLQICQGGPLSSEDRDELRAKLIRTSLCQN